MADSSVFNATAIAAVISGGFALYSNWKNTKIVHITDERKQWRDDLRKIAVKIKNCIDEKEFKSCMAELSVKINAYGMYNSDDLLADGHIWWTINKCNNDIANYAKYKEIFVRYISALLKYDWERSKREISGNLIFGLFLCPLQIMIIWLLISTNSNFNTINKVCLIIIASICSVLVLALSMSAVLLLKYLSKKSYKLKSHRILKWILTIIIPIFIDIIIFSIVFLLMLLCSIANVAINIKKGNPYSFGLMLIFMAPLIVNVIYLMGIGVYETLQIDKYSNLIDSINQKFSKELIKN